MTRDLQRPRSYKSWSWERAESQFPHCSVIWDQTEAAARPVALIPSYSHKILWALEQASRLDYRYLYYYKLNRWSKRPVNECITRWIVGSWRTTYNIFDDVAVSPSFEPYDSSDAPIDIQDYDSPCWGYINNLPQPFRFLT